MPTSEQIVTSNMNRFASVERGLKRAMDGLSAIGKTIPTAYANGDIQGGDALKLRNTGFELAGMAAALHSEVIAYHEACTTAAQEAGKDQPGAYAELPPLNPGVPTPKGSGR